MRAGAADRRTVSPPPPTTQKICWPPPPPHPQRENFLCCGQVLKKKKNECTRNVCGCCCRCCLYDCIVYADGTQRGGMSELLCPGTPSVVPREEHDRHVSLLRARASDVGIRCMWPIGYDLLRCDDATCLCDRHCYATRGLLLIIGKRERLYLTLVVWQWPHQQSQSVTKL